MSARVSSIAILLAGCSATTDVGGQAASSSSAGTTSAATSLAAATSANGSTATAAGTTHSTTSSATASTGASTGDSGTGSTTSATTNMGATSGGASTSTGTTGAASTGGAATTSSSGTTGSPPTLGYQPYDAGPPLRPDSGCPMYAALYTDAGGCVQCLGDGDCPAPLVCDSALHLCALCDAAHPTCPAGQVCDLQGFPGDTCLPDCRVDDSACQDSTLGRACDFDSGFCLLGCFTNADCPATQPVCQNFPSGPLATCTQCSSEYGNDPDAGCPAGTFCAGSSCLYDCSEDAGPCLPGICDLTGALGARGSCAADACRTDADCVGGPNPVCTAQSADSGIGHCIGSGSAPCGTVNNCPAVGIAMPVCAEPFGNATASYCTSRCAGLTGLVGSCGLQPCLDFEAPHFPGINGGTGYFCGCTTDADCQGQPNTPSCLPVSDAGIDAGAGLWGACGCVVGGCGPDAVCETRSPELGLYVQPPPLGACIPSCTAGNFDCGLHHDGVCNPTTGYCAGCLDDGQCAQPTPKCLSNDDVPGDGTCGCAGPADCADGLTCDLPDQIGASCAPPCVRTPDGYDSCLYGVEGTADTGRCNTESGLCEQCLADADCLGRSAVAGLQSNLAQSLCSSVGRCEQCNSKADCPASAPGCLNGACGACATSADCPASAPECIAVDTEYGGGSLCVPPCTADGGECASDSPTPVCDVTLGYCVQCASADDCSPTFGGQTCTNGFCEWPN